MKDTGYYIYLNDAIDILSLFSEKDADGFTPQQVVQMLPRVWMEFDNEKFVVEKLDSDLSTSINLCNCEDCIHDEILYSARNYPYHRCRLEDSFMHKPPITEFKCTQYISEKDGLKEDDN